MYVKKAKIFFEVVIVLTVSLCLFCLLNLPDETTHATRGQGTQLPLYTRFKFFNFLTESVFSWTAVVNTTQITAPASVLINLTLTNFDANYTQNSVGRIIILNAEGDPAFDEQIPFTFSKVGNNSIVSTLFRPIVNQFSPEGKYTTVGLRTHVDTLISTPNLVNTKLPNRWPAGWGTVTPSGATLILSPSTIIARDSNISSQWFFNVTNRYDSTQGSGINLCQPFGPQTQKLPPSLSTLGSVSFCHPTHSGLRGNNVITSVTLTGTVNMDSSYSRLQDLTLLIDGTINVKSPNVEVVDSIVTVRNGRISISAISTITGYGINIQPAWSIFGTLNVDSNLTVVNVDGTFQSGTVTGATNLINLQNSDTRFLFTKIQLTQPWILNLASSDTYMYKNDITNLAAIFANYSDLYCCGACGDSFIGYNNSVLTVDAVTCTPSFSSVSLTNSSIKFLVAGTYILSDFPYMTLSKSFQSSGDVSVEVVVASDAPADFALLRYSTLQSTPCQQITFKTKLNTTLLNSKNWDLLIKCSIDVTSNYLWTAEMVMPFRTKSKTILMDFPSQGLSKLTVRNFVLNSSSINRQEFVIQEYKGSSPISLTFLCQSDISPEEIARRCDRFYALLTTPGTYLNSALRVVNNNFNSSSLFWNFPTIFVTLDWSYDAFEPETQWFGPIAEYFNYPRNYLRLDPDYGYYAGSVILGMQVGAENQTRANDLGNQFSQALDDANIRKTLKIVSVNRNASSRSTAKVVPSHSSHTIPSLYFISIGFMVILSLW